MMGKPKMTSWFQTPVTVTASVTGRPLKPQARNIANDTAIPGAKPPGAMYVDAVDACVTTNACRNLRPGRAACQGGAYVARFTSTTASSARTCGHESALTTCQTSR